MYRLAATGQTENTGASNDIQLTSNTIKCAFVVMTALPGNSDDITVFGLVDVTTSTGAPLPRGVARTVTQCDATQLYIAGTAGTKVGWELWEAYRVAPAL